MARIKGQIAGKRITPTKIEILNPNKSNLIPGQKVLLYRTTDQDIVAATGRVIGKKQQVLGTGKVKEFDGCLIVEVARNEVTPTRTIKSSSLPAIRGAKVRFSSLHPQKIKKKDNMILIKAIEE